MAIHRQGGDDYEVECDNCGDSSEFLDTSWADMISCLKDDEWRIYKDKTSDEWRHLCRECKD